IVTYKIFTKVPINQITINKLSSFQGFWSQNLIKENEKFNQYSQTINGEKYLVADIRKIALFPLKSGKLVIEPLDLECVAQIKRQTKSRTGDPFFDDFFNDSFFSDAYATVEKSLKSNPLVINVRPLPTADKTADFSGAVGDFTFTTELDKTKVKTNDAITLKCIISGKGNLQLIDKLNITFPPDFETYDPKITSNITTSGAGVSGNQTFEYLIIPRRAGKFKINPISFTYYDLEKKRYITSKSPVYDIEVAKGEGDAGSAVYAGGSKEDIQYIGNDIRHIRKDVPHLKRIGSLFFGSVSFFLLLIIPLLLFLGMVIYWKKQERKRSDGMLMKNLKATKVARKRLKKASNFLRENKQEPFYDEIARALWGYISDKFGIPIAELSMDSVSDALIQRKLPRELADEFIETLNDTEYARFAPGEKSLIMEKIYQKALEIITKIEKELR
ncbi:MAG TPA: BatD family protein, partial [Bacteroidales bacterium]|nr:BatD family protein [Bacteroidales bacterium]